MTTLGDQIKCVRQELAMRRSLYPGFVANGKMKGVEAEKEIATIQAVHDTLVDVAKDAEFAGGARG